jgi:hypothetical protein
MRTEDKGSRKGWENFNFVGKAATRSASNDCILGSESQTATTLASASRDSKSDVFPSFAPSK